MSQEIEKITATQLHKAIRNYLINELNVTQNTVRTELEQIIEKHIEKEINKILKESDYIEKMILKHVTNVLNNGVGDGYNKQPINSFIKKELENQVKTQIMERFNISLTIKENTK